MKQILKTLSPYLVISLLSILLFRECSKPIEGIKTTIDIEKIIDSLKRTIKIPEPIKDTLYLDSIIYLKSDPIVLKGKDTTIYKIDTLKIPVEVNRYDTELKANNAIANLSIYTSGKLFDVKGTIMYEKQTTTVERIKTIYKDATYLYFETSVMPFWKKAEVGIDRTIGNKLIIGTSIEYIPYENQAFLNAKIGLNLSRNKK